MKRVGRVVALTRFPVKSMAGEPREAVEFGWSGIVGDRQYSFYRAADATRFPWLSARDHDRLVLYHPTFSDPDDPRRATVRVDTPEGETLALDSPALLERLSRDAGQDLRLLQMGRGLHDAMPVSIVTTATHDALDVTHGTTIDRRRFRTNIVIESDEPETAWSGARLVIGDKAVLVANQPIPRCALITIDPVTAVRDPSIMRVVAQSFDNKIGVYCAPTATGRISVDDEVSLLD